MRIFIDTSAFYALLDQSDGNHPKGRKAWLGMLGGGDVAVTNNYVLVETFALLQSRLGVNAVRAFHEDMLPMVHVEFVSPELHRAGTAALLAAGRRGLSLVDCVTFETMRYLGIKNAFTFDSHFKDQGFDVTP